MSQTFQNFGMWHNLEKQIFKLVDRFGGNVVALAVLDDKKDSKKSIAEGQRPTNKPINNSTVSVCTVKGAGSTQCHTLHNCNYYSEPLGNRKTTGTRPFQSVKQPHNSLCRFCCFAFQSFTTELGWRTCACFLQLL